MGCLQKAVFYLILEPKHICLPLFYHVVDRRFDRECSRDVHPGYRISFTLFEILVGSVLNQTPAHGSSEDVYFIFNGSKTYAT